MKTQQGNLTTAIQGQNIHNCAKGLEYAKTYFILKRTNIFLFDSIFHLVISLRFFLTLFLVLHFGLVPFAKVNSNINDKGQKRFTLAHEMGHYFNERDLRKNALYNCSAEDINSFKSKKIWEANANEFASELLMPTDWFKKFTGRRKLNFDLIKDIAEYFNTSLTATAIKYALTGTTPAAVIMSKEGKVLWHCPNEYFPLKWIPKNYNIDRKSKAYKFFKTGETNENDTLVMANTWYENTKGKEDLYLWEQNVCMPNYKSVLTLLWEFNG